MKSIGVTFQHKKLQKKNIVQNPAKLSNILATIEKTARNTMFPWLKTMVFLPRF